MSAKSESILTRLQEAIIDTSKQKTTPYDTTATVTRIENGTAWVHIPGGVDETPVKLTINAKAGDNVQVRVSGGKAFLVGNGTAPPTDDTKAVEAITFAGVVNRVAVSAGKVADRALKIAGDTAQYFWTTETGADTGAHITEIPQDEFLDDPDNGGANLLLRSIGIAIRQGLAELATFSTSGLHVSTFDDNGNEIEIAHLGYGLGNAQSGTEEAPYYTLGTRAANTSVGNYSVAEGNGTEASAFSSHAEGRWSRAKGNSSHAEGFGCIAYAQQGHAEGELTVARYVAHAEGSETEANGDYSHAQNLGTVAESEAQTTIGRYNVKDSNGTYAFIIGNGTADNDRKDILRVDWNGNTYATSYNNLSDIRLKKNVEDTDVKALDAVKAIRMRQFDWLNTGEHESIGVVADELEKIDPDFATGGGYNKDGSINVKTVDQTRLVYYLIKAVQELSAEVDKLKGGD